jgi:hypothetical protein
MTLTNAQNEFCSFGRCGPRLLQHLMVFLIVITIGGVQIWFNSATMTRSSQRQQLLLQQQLLLRQQRDNLSLAINKLQERCQQLVCNAQKQRDASQTGGYCDREVHHGHLTDGGFANALSEFFAGKTVVSLGDGLGVYRKRLLKAGKVKSYDSYDGAPFIENTTAQQVHFLDLTLQQYWLPVYDWVLCVEVMEHIPSQYESIVLDNIDRAAGHGVVLSWAVASQGGFHHVNPRPPEYVDQVLEHRGFKRDVKASEKLRQSSTLFWLKKNVNVYRRVRVDERTI